MSSSAERFFDSLATIRAILASSVRWHGNRDNSENFAKILNPLSKLRPCCITNRLGKMSVSHHVPHLQILIGYQVARPDYAPCQLHGKVFTLPTYFEVETRKFISKLDSIFRTFLCFGKAALQPFQRLLTLAKMSGVFNLVAFTISQEMVESYIQANSFTSWFSFLNAFRVDTKLCIVPISTTHNPYSLKLFQLIEMQVTSSPKLESSCFKSIAKSDVATVIRELPTASFIFNTPVSLFLLKSWITLFYWLVFLAIVKKSSNCTPRSFSRSLSSYRVKFINPRKVFIFHKNSAISTQFISANIPVIHPVSQASITNKTSSSNRLVQRLILLFCSFKFCLKYQHCYVKITDVIISRISLKTRHPLTESNLRFDSVKGCLVFSQQFISPPQSQTWRRDELLFLGKDWENFEPITKLKCGITKGKKLDAFLYNSISQSKYFFKKVFCSQLSFYFYDPLLAYRI